MFNIVQISQQSHDGDVIALGVLCLRMTKYPAHTTFTSTEFNASPT
jgi:hypothetical protein